MPGRYGAIDYAKATRWSFLFGVSLFVIGALGEAAIHTAGLQVPGWEETLLVDLEFLGAAIALFSPFVFGVFLPLTE